MVIAALEVPDELTATVLQTLGIAAAGEAAILRQRAPTGSYQVGESGGPDLAYVEEAVLVLQGCQKEAAEMGHRFIHPLHVLLAVLRRPGVEAWERFGAAAISYAVLRDAFLAEVP